jgi:outer membrane protein
VAEARAAYRPTVTVNASYQFQFEPLTINEFNGTSFAPAPFNPYQRTVTAGVQVNIPLYSGGQRGSKVRQTLEQTNQAAYTVEGQRRAVMQAISQFWAQLLSTHAQTLSNEEQVKAAAIAAEGQRQEAQVGLRTTIDVLNAEEEQRNAELQLVTSRHDEYVATAQLLANMGRLEIKYLNADLPPYDPKRNFDRIRYKGWLPIDPLLLALDNATAPGEGGQKRVTRAPIDGELIERAPSEPKPKEP